jgi:FlaA1/EpsC-like NDP-sugar epimerase
VLASHDSVADVFARQLKTGKALTVTTARARRYFLTIEEAVELLLSASSTAERSALFVPDLRRQYLIADLAEFMGQELAPERGQWIQFSSLCPGDKECEQLWSHEERPGVADAYGLVPIFARPWSPGQAAHATAELRAASDAGNLAALIAVLRELVPDYTPSATILRLAEETSPRLAS